MTPIPGVYRHYKGRNYRMIGVGKHTETNEIMVIYIGLYEDGPIWVRPLDQFMADIEHEGKMQPRFKKIGD